MKRPRLSIVTFGCRANQYESDLMRRILAANYEIVPHDAAVWILNACTVTGLAERKARQTARRVRRANPDALILVVGCLADAVEQGLTAFPDVDLLAGNAWKGHIDRVVEQALTGVRGLLPPIEPLAAAAERSGGPVARVRAFLRIQDGCARSCTYCRATQVRGAPRSKPIPDVLDEARGLVERGFPEIVLTGIDLAQYAPPRGRLADALRAVLSIDELVRLRIASINPSGVTDALVDALASDDRACPHFHVPLQSGDDRILERMARDYTVAQYLGAIARVRRTLPAATFGTDLIVGFPGEDDAAFENTCHIVEAVGFSNLHAFRYSPRPGTVATGLDGAVPERTKRARADALEARWHRTMRSILDKRIGSIQDVLVEERREGVWRGYTRDYIHVRFISNEEIPVGSTRPVRVTGSAIEHLEGMDEQRKDAH
jgi:threonylcarbamoyladenosine tRNA methylthiotransferase MtaB